MPNFNSSRIHTPRDLLLLHSYNVGYKSLFGRVDVHNQNSYILFHWKKISVVVMYEAEMIETMWRN